MRDDLGERSVLVVDTGGLFLPVAMRLARDFGRVYYSSEWVESGPTVNRAMVGNGFLGIEKVDDPLEVIHDIDLLCCPDCSHPHLQAHAESMGVAVWGSRQGVELELERHKWMDLIGELGLDVPPHRKVAGVAQLEDMLMDSEECYVKISKWRGTMETFHWRGWGADQWWLAALKARLGPVGERVKFVVCEPIEDAVELGVDTWCVGGQWPDTMLHGVEAKDKAYLGHVMAWDDMPKEVSGLLEVLSGTLREHEYRNWVSVEMRLTDTHAYPIDFSARAGLPSSASQMELWENYSDIVWAGAHGELVEPVPIAEYAAELAVSMKGESGQWAVVEVPGEFRRWLKLGPATMVDGKHCFAPEPGGHDEHVGWLVGVGDSPGSAVDAVLEHASKLPEGMSVDVGALAQVIKEVEAEAEKGVEFSEQPMPEAGVVVERP